MRPGVLRLGDGDTGYGNAVAVRTLLEHVRPIFGILHSTSAPRDAYE